MQLQAELCLRGTPVSRGIAIGKIFFLSRNEYHVLEVDINPSEAKREISRYRNALLRSKQDIKRLQKQLESEAAVESILILDAQLEMLQDPLLTREIERDIIETGKNVEFVFQKAIERIQKQFDSLKDHFFVERFKDLKDLSSRIMAYLQESSQPSLNVVPPNSIVCSNELTSSDAAEATNLKVLAFISEIGGATSHAAIVAKSKGIPYITNVDLKTLKENSEQLAIIDGRTGLIILNPSSETVRQYEVLKQEIQHQTKNLEKIIQWPAETFDGFTIKLSANLEVAHEVELVHQLGGNGIGLFRSEFIFLQKGEIPSEEEQYKIYSNIAESMANLPVVIRTFDFSGDKVTQSYPLNTERKTFLGRSTRFFLKEEDLFKTQIRAILRASIKGNISILFPMVSTIVELQKAKKMVQDIRKELGLKNKIRIGCMIEVPSAALLADHFAKECDFISIGTNDLVQYSLAVDRADPSFVDHYEPTDPSIIRLIKLITDQANKESIPVTVCGEIASDPRFASLLIGLGVQELSVIPRYLPIIKNAIRHTSIVDSVRLAESALTLTNAKAIMDLISSNYQKSVPNDLSFNN